MNQTHLHERGGPRRGRCPPRPRALLGVVGLAALLLLGAAASQAQTGVVFSPDITAALGPVQPSLLADEQVGYDDAAGRVYRLAGFAPPPDADLTGIAYDVASGTWLASFDVTVALPGLPPGTAAEPRDVVAWAPGSGLYSIAFDGSLVGVPANARIDAVSVEASGDLLLSFDISTSLPGAGFVDDEDVVRFNGAIFVLLFDGSANGLAPGLDVDGVHRDLSSNDLWLSFETSGTVGALFFDDEDVIAFDLSLGTYAALADSSLSDPAAWPPADLTAVPEPGLLPAVMAGAALLGLLEARRRRRR